MSNYSFNKLCSPSKLKKEIEESLITIALDYITTSESPVNTTVYFKAELSTDEKNTLNDIIQNHIITPIVEDPLVVNLAGPKDATGAPIIRNSPFSDTGGFRFRGASFKETVDSNSTKVIDYQITQERWINGGQLIVNNIGDDDKGTFQVVDKDYLYAGILYPADFGGIAWSIAEPSGVVLDEFVKDFYIPTDKKLEIVLTYPARILAGLYLRLIYTSSHTDGCLIKCNLYLHWKT
jgi:hypothetical protein